MQDRNPDQFRFMDDEPRRRGEFGVRIDEREQLRDARIGAAGECEEPHGLREFQRQDRHQQQRRSAADDKDRAPTENPQNITITMVARRRCGLNSDVSAMAFGIAPPRPSPVRNRITSRVLTSRTNAVASVPMPNANVETMMIFRRPMRSASGPNSSAPILNPNRPAENTGPSAPLVRCHSAASDGAT